MGLQLPGGAMTQEEFVATRGFACPFCRGVNSPSWDMGKGIDADEDDYGQVLFVCGLATDRAPAGTAYERFTAAGPVALLPMGEAYGAICAVPTAEAATVAAFDARARRIPAPGETLDDDTRLVRVGDKVIAAAASDVSRAEYARFVLATGRPAALCRERVSVFRLLAPRSWKAPGFEQSPAQPVVCISWNDAAAYAKWLAAHKGHRYRLPTAAEARALPGASSAKPVATWVDACVQGCSQRLSTGRSWRGSTGARPLDPARGYDDVGFRLVRDQ